MGSSSGPYRADTETVSRERTLRKIEQAFADAVARGDLPEAEAWAAIAFLAEQARLARTSAG